MKHLLTLTFLSIIGLTHAQIPSFIPSTGLVGWWPFNGNANDESGDNGIVYGAVLTNYRNDIVNGVAFAPNQTSNQVLTGSDSLGCVGADTIIVTVLDNASSTTNLTAIDSFILNGQTYTQSGTHKQVMVKF